MLKFLSSLSFLYLFTIVALFVYGWFYYKRFARNRSYSNRFPLVFSLTALACFGFLFINIHAPLSLKTFSNLDHHFLRHDGFAVNKQLELGRADTVNFRNNTYNSFLLEKNGGSLKVNSIYSEEPFYASAGDKFKIISSNFPALGHELTLQVPGTLIELSSLTDSSFQLKINEEHVCTVRKNITKAISAWTLFGEQPGFINTRGYTETAVVSSLKNIYLLRDDVSRSGYGPLCYFISGKAPRYAGRIFYDQKELGAGDLAFKQSLNDQSTIAWGIGFLDNNKNQYQLSFLKNDSFRLISRFPLAYPLTGENKNDWTPQLVNKFLVSDPRHLQNMPAVFEEGFLFAPFNGDSELDFAPVLLGFKKEGGNKDLVLQARFLEGNASPVTIRGGRFLLPASSASFSWMFSIQNTFNWDYGSMVFSQGKWQGLIFGSLGLFFFLVLATSLVTPAGKQSWIWQLLSVVTMVLLTTRFFLYWRYKSFPPYEGLDLPSLQQLNSFWNFGVILIASALLAIVFGFGSIRKGFHFIAKNISRLAGTGYRPLFKRKLMGEDEMARQVHHSLLVKKTGIKTVYFVSWLIILTGCGGYAALNHFDPATCRHLALLLIFFYFIFIYISYRFSPLVAASDRSWWSIRTGSSWQVLINNPVKVLLSLSLLAVFAFIDIGFAIIFLNFLLFNEAFLCINYAIAGLSAGSRKNASLFSLLGIIYLAMFVANLIYGPYIFNLLLGLSKLFYIAGYFFFALLVSYMITRLLNRSKPGFRLLTGTAAAALIFTIAFLFFPRQKILDKAAITKYRIDVMTMPVDKAVEIAYQDGKTYEPVIRAAQNQWFINTFIFEKNNPLVQQAGFHLLPHAPQTKGARYNAQATDLVASRFLVAEHGKWSVLLYVLLLLVPTVLLASFYKLYPDFTNRINNNYPTITTGFSLLNYLLISALLVILAATGRYIFFGQDLPFGSILSKQSIVFPALILISVSWLFNRIPLEQYPNRKKLVPGSIVFTLLLVLLFVVKPVFNKDKEFGAAGIAKDMDSFVETRLQPLYDYIDTSAKTHRYSLARKDKIFTDSLKQLLDAGYLEEAGKFFRHELAAYAKSDFSRHLDQRKLIYLDLYSGRPQLAVNDNFFHVDPPPHLRELWTGNVFGDSSNWNISLWNSDGSVISTRTSNYTDQSSRALNAELSILGKGPAGENSYKQLSLANNSGKPLTIKQNEKTFSLEPGGSMPLSNPSRLTISGENGKEQVLVIQPDAFMKNYYVNGNRFYVYPMAADFIWARNFAETVSSAYSSKGLTAKNAFISLDALLMDSLTARISTMLEKDTAYKKGAEYGICIADGNGRLVAMADHIKGLERPDPNDKAGFNKVIRGNQGYVSQSVLRKEIGNINLLRMNPGPGSTLKPIIFSAIASQLKIDWDLFAAEGFTQKQQIFGGEKVAEYDFEKNNGRISSVVDYLRYSDNYYHSNLLLLGSYSKQSMQDLLTKHFATNNPAGNFQWPYFSYNGKQYWLQGFKNWPGYTDGKVNFGSDSSFVSIGLFNNYGIYTEKTSSRSDPFPSAYDSLMLGGASRGSGFILPEYALFDQKGTGMDNRKPNEVFMSSFRGHVKGSSQVMIPPVKMLDAFGKLLSQNRNYALTLNPYATEPVFKAFDVDNGVQYANYLSIIREKVFEGMKQALYNGTAARLGNLLKGEKDYHYYAKTGTTGDDELKTKSKLFTILISKKDVTHPDHNFRKNRFFTIYFTSQNGPAKQNEEFQAEIIKYLQGTALFNRYMNGN